MINLYTANRLKYDIEAEFMKFGINIDVDCWADDNTMMISSNPSIKDLLGL